MVNASVKHRLAENAVQKPSSVKSAKPGKKKALKKTIVRSKATRAKTSSRKSVLKATGKKKSRA
jgi:hypothetical protein